MIIYNEYKEVVKQDTDQAMWWDNKTIMEREMTYRVSSDINIVQYIRILSFVDMYKTADIKIYVRRDPKRTESYMSI